MGGHALSEDRIRAILPPYIRMANFVLCLVSRLSMDWFFSDRKLCNPRFSTDPAPRIQISDPAQAIARQHARPTDVEPPDAARCVFALMNDASRSEPHA